MTTMQIDRAVVEQALEALEAGDMAWAVMNVEGVKQAIRAALAQEQADRFCDNNCTWADHAPGCVRAEQAEPVLLDGGS